MSGLFTFNMEFQMVVAITQNGSRIILDAPDDPARGQRAAELATILADVRGQAGQSPAVARYRQLLAQHLKADAEARKARAEIDQLTAERDALLAAEIPPDDLAGQVIGLEARIETLHRDTRPAELLRAVLDKARAVAEAEVVAVAGRVHQERRQLLHQRRSELLSAIMSAVGGHVDELADLAAALTAADPAFGGVAAAVLDA